MDRSQMLAFQAAFRAKAQHVLSARERQFLQQTLNEFARNKSLTRFLTSLESVLRTPAQLDLLRYIRLLVPERHELRVGYDKLAPYHLMQTPLVKGELLRAEVQDVIGLPDASECRDVLVRRAARDEPLGISIRGGKELGLGLFVVSVDQGSLADAAGLRAGDQILSVNCITLADLPHCRAAGILDACTTMQLRVQSMSFIPVAQVEHRKYSWVDPQTGETMVQAGHQPRAGQARTVTLRRAHGSLGLSIRGGAEHGLSIYISAVDCDSQAQRLGLQGGDEIIAINGQPAGRMTHVECARALSSPADVALTVLPTGLVPARSYRGVDFKWRQVEATTSKPGTPRQAPARPKLAHRLSTASLPSYPLDGEPVLSRRSSLQLETLTASHEEEFDPALSPLDRLEAKLSIVFEYEHVETILEVATEYIRGRRPLEAMLNAIFPLLVTRPKTAVLHSLRPCIKVAELSEFDFLVARWELGDCGEDDLELGGFEALLSTRQPAATTLAPPPIY